tara:strand:+ start:961 stop:1314 length:354 start_codon:yes stop_codon:yes gene_type:complete
MKDKDMVMERDKNGRIRIGGYVIKSKLLQGGGAAIKNLNVKNGGGDLERMAVPAGLFLIHQTAKPDNELNIQEEVGVLSDSIYDKLLGLIGVSRPRSKTRKASKRKKGKKMRKTRKK